MKKPTLFRSLTGLEIKEFDTIYNKINTNYKECEKQRLNKENRKHQIGAGHPFKLSLQDRLLATSENLYFSKNGMLKNRVTMLFVFLKWGFRRLPVNVSYLLSTIHNLHPNGFFV